MDTTADGCPFRIESVGASHLQNYPVWSVVVAVTVDGEAYRVFWCCAVPTDAEARSIVSEKLRALNMREDIRAHEEAVDATS